MEKNKLISHSLLHSLGVVVYISLVAMLMNNGSRLFGETDTLLTAISMLMLFTISAAIVGLLVFGRPVMWYLNGLKKEAVQFTLYTISWLVIEALLIFIILFIIAL